VHNKELLEKRDNDDFIASEELVSKYLVQLAESDKIEPILESLLTASGHEFHMRPAGNYCDTNTNLPFSDIVASGIQRNELVVGYRKNGVCKLNPNKSLIINFTDSDSIIVLSEQ
jgi:hypothetical protein